jgi:NitT/TauT family transport system ATP-binding protein
MAAEPGPCAIMRTVPSVPAAIELTQVSRAFDGLAAVAGVDLVVEPGRFVTLFGPSGCGKSTLLRLAAGLVAPDAGEVRVHGDTAARACAAKEIGFVPQAPALLPWRTVLDNVRLPWQVNRRAPASDVDPKDLLDQVGLADAADLLPAALSGGMAQRVAIARAFAAGPGVLLMDEPFAALDELTRETLRHVLLDIWEGDRTTVLFVTHSPAEAVYLSDEVVVLSPRPGRVRQIIPVDLGRPRAPGVERTPAFLAVEERVRVALRAAA